MDPESLSNSREFSLSPKRPCTCEQSSPLSSVFPGFADSLVSVGITGTPGTRASWFHVPPSCGVHQCSAHFEGYIVFTVYESHLFTAT